MASSNFKLFDENKTNMMQDGEYGTNNQRLNGLQSGIASSMLQNKFQYQMSLISYAIGQLMVQNNIDANDSQAVSTFVNNLSNTFLQKVIDKATTGQAQAGTDDTKWLTPALVKAFYDYRKASVEEAKAGTDQNKFITPYTLSNFVGEYSKKKFYKVGDVVVTARTDLGSDWALCNGAFFTSSQYPELAGVMGAVTPEKMVFSTFSNAPAQGELKTPVAILNDGSFIYTYRNGADQYVKVMRKRADALYDLLEVEAIKNIGSRIANVHFTSDGEQFYCVLYSNTDGNSKILRIDKNGNGTIINANVHFKLNNAYALYYLNGTLVIFDSSSVIFYSSSPYSFFTQADISPGVRFSHITKYNNKFYLFTDEGTYSGASLSSMTKINNLSLINGYAIINPSNGAIIYFTGNNTSGAKIASSPESVSMQDISLGFNYMGGKCIVYNNICYFVNSNGQQFNLYKRDFSINSNTFTVVKGVAQSTTLNCLYDNFVNYNNSYFYVNMSSGGGGIQGTVTLSLPNISLDKVYAYIRVKSST